MVLIFERRACVCVMGRGGGGWGGVEVGSRRVWVFVGVQKKPTDFFAYKKVKTENNIQIIINRSSRYGNSIPKFEKISW